MTFKSQLHTTLMDNLLAHLHLAQSFNIRALSQSRTTTHLIQWRLCQRGLSHFVERFRFHQQHIGIASHHPILIRCVVIGRLSLREQKLSHIIARSRICRTIGHTVKGRTTCIKYGLLLAQITYFILTYKLSRGLVPTIAACCHTRVTRTSKGGQPGGLILIRPKVIIGLSIILYLKD